MLAYKAKYIFYILFKNTINYSAIIYESLDPVKFISLFYLAKIIKTQIIIRFLRFIDNMV
jgi:hypothetical protein